MVTSVIEYFFFANVDMKDWVLGDHFDLTLALISAIISRAVVLVQSNCTFTPSPAKFNI